jgi:hypothetical protein
MSEALDNSGVNEDFACGVHVGCIEACVHISHGLSSLMKPCMHFVYMPLGYELLSYLCNICGLLGLLPSSPHSRELGLTMSTKYK